MTNACFFILGLIFGLGMYILLLKAFRRVDGTLIVNDEDPETTRWTLQMNIDPREIPKKKIIFMDVKGGPPN